MFICKKGKHEKRKKASSNSKILKHEGRANNKQKSTNELTDKLKSIVEESYKTLRTNIQYSSFGKKIKTLAVTSAEMGEGKSTVAVNISLSFAKSEKRVILIDCDLRKPSVHKSFNLLNIVGVSDILLGKVTAEKAKQKKDDNFDILTSGKIPPNPSEMLASSAMTNLIEKLKEEYDVIVLDTAPVNLVTDAQVLSTKVDGTILVVKAATTKKNSVIEAKNLLNKVGANIVGTVLYAAENIDSRKYY